MATELEVRMRVQDTSSVLFGLDIDLFWSKVDRGAPDECWLWRAGRSMGYGSVGWEFQGRARYVRAHRAAWILTNGEIPSGLCVCHKCDTPLCCNSHHFFLGTLSENQRDKIAKGRAVAGYRILTPSQVAVIRSEYAAGGVTQRELGMRFGVSSSAISKITRGQMWR
jgi:hypothetical protein